MPTRTVLTHIECVYGSPVCDIVIYCYNYALPPPPSHLVPDAGHYTHISV